MVYLLIALCAALAAVVLVILVRTLAFQPKKSAPYTKTPVEIDASLAAEQLAAMVRCRTVSNADSACEDTAEFEKFEKLLPALFPNVFETAERINVNERAILLCWRGKSDASPTVLMSHYDVVSVEEKEWTHPPFDGVIENDVLWGRGTLDTKATLAAALHAANALIERGFVPQNDVYFAFSGNEEIAGGGAPAIVAFFKEHGITPALVLDEGGAVVENVFPGVTTPCAMVGIAEKGMMNLEFSVTSSGGHASAPPAKTPIGILSGACTRTEAHPFPMRMTPPAAQMFDTMARHSTFLYRMIFANLWLFRPALDRLCQKSGGEMNALVRTTVAFTQMQGSKGMNVLPAKATMLANLRLVQGENEQSVLRHVRRAIKDERVELRIVGGHTPSRISDTDSEAWSRVCDTIKESFDNCIVSPYLMVACSDSRHYGEISDRVFRFSAMAMSKEERATIHGNDEGIPLKSIRDAAEFYTRLLLRS